MLQLNEEGNKINWLVCTKNWLVCNSNYFVTACNSLVVNSLSLGCYYNIRHCRSAVLSGDLRSLNYCHDNNKTLFVLYALNFLIGIDYSGGYICDGGITDIDM